jgi:protein O-GlcNAc transferase
MIRLVGIGTVRNEEDILESFVRHSLRFVDELRLIDHISTDRTAAILAALQAEGLPLRVSRHTGLAQMQDILSTRLAREAFRDGADWVIPLDADEFIDAPDPAQLRAALAGIDKAGPGRIAWWPWVSMVPHPEDDATCADPARRIVHRLATEAVPTPKCLLPRTVTLRPDWQIAPGNHHVRLGSLDPLPMVRLPKGLALRHYPLRSLPQFTAKIVLSHLAWLPRKTSGSTIAGHIGSMFEKLRAGWIPNADDLPLYAASYQNQECKFLPELCRDPLKVTHALQHTPPEDLSVLPRLLDWAAEMVTTHAPPAPPALFRELPRDQSAALSTPPAAPPFPQTAAAAFNAANAAFRANRWAEALDGTNRAIAAAPMMVQAHVLKARALRSLGDAEGARAAFDAALACEPAQFDALLERGNLRRLQDDAEGAAADYAAAMAARPQDTRPALALARLEEGRMVGDTSAHRRAAADRAAVAFHRALERALLADNPAKAAATLCQDMARQRMAHADLPRALDALREARLHAVRGASDLLPWIDLDLAEVLLRLGLTPEAQALMERLSACTDRELLRPLAQLAYRFNFWAEAVAILRRVAELAPEEATAWLELADLQARSWLLEQALASLDRAEAVGNVPTTAARSLRASVASRMGDARQGLELYELLVAEGQPAFASHAAMSLLYADHVTPDEVAARHRALFANWGEGARPRASFGANPDPDRPLRVGMVTADLHHQHPVNIFLQPLLARWDHDRLPLTVFFTGTTVDAQTRLARTRARGWHECALPALPSAVAAAGIDILIDLSGHTAGGALALFARRMAPVQVTWLGYPGSTGVPNMDWLIGDAIVTPPEADALCSERVARLSQTVFCFAPEADHPLPDFATLSRDRPFTFGSFNNIPKLTPRTIALWSSVLAAVPDARLLLRAPSFQDPAAIARFRRLFAEAGTDPARLVFRGPVGLDAMMQAYAEIDVALDPLPYTGGTTTLQALWMGVPVVTLQGGHFVSRMGASFMTAAGLQDWVSLDAPAYIARATRAAADRPALLALKAGLRDRLLARPAWDADHFAADFACTLRRIWQDTMTTR